MASGKFLLTIDQIHDLFSCLKDSFLRNSKPMQHKRSEIRSKSSSNEFYVILKEASSTSYLLILCLSIQKRGRTIPFSGHGFNTTPNLVENDPNLVSLPSKQAPLTHPLAGHLSYNQASYLQIMGLLPITVYSLCRNQLSQSFTVK